MIDITNFEGSQIEEIYDLINNSKHRVLIIVNKIDALPKGFTVERLQLWVKRQIEHKMGPDIEWTICLTSAKMATGCQKVLEIISKIKAQMQGLQYRPKIYVLGATNSGKSSFLNALLFKSTKYRNKNKSKKMYRQKYNVLTESAAPGTTLEMVTVEEFSLGFRVIDTPGIPNLRQCTSFIENFDDLKDAMPQKRLQSISLGVKQAQTVWLGALARIDMLSGSEKYFTFYVPQGVTVHRTMIEGAERVYRK